ncbi:MAG: Rad52/Rad22 family DNA repair protein [Isosphaeraceae bacterium]
MTLHLELFAALAAPFEPEEIKSRSQAGRSLPYITSRTIMNRLDEVLGPSNWWDEYQPLEHSVICRLTVRLPDGTVLTKCDAGGYAGMADPGDDDKSGFTDAFKRAAVKFGVGRYLYRDGVPKFARPDHHARLEPAPSPTVSPPVPASSFKGAPVAEASRRPSTDGPSPPRSGRALFAWTKKQDESNNYGLVQHLNSWARRQKFPARMVDWDADQTAQAYAEACRKVQTIQAMPRPAEAALTN